MLTAETIESLCARIARLEKIADQLDAGLIAVARAQAADASRLDTHAHDMLAMDTYSPHSIRWTGTALWHKEEE